MTRGRWPRPVRGDAAVLAFVGAWYAGLIFLSPLGGLPADVVNLAYFAMGPIVFVAHWRVGAVSAESRTRLAWRLLAGSYATIWLSGLLWTYWSLVSPDPMPAALSLLTEQAYIPLAVVAFLCLPVDPAFTWRNARARVDAALFAVGGLALSWHFAIDPHQRAATGASAGTAIAEWVLALAASFALLRARDRATRAAVGLALTAHLVFVLTDFFWRGALDEYGPGHWLDALWFGAWVLRWLSARRILGEPPGAPLPEDRYRGSLAPALFVAGSYGLLVLSLWAEQGARVLVVGIAAAIMTALLVFRQRLTRIENASLAAEKARQAAVFRSIVASATDLVLLVGDDLRIAYASPSVRRIVGPDAGPTLPDLLHPADRPGVLAWLAERSSSAVQRSYRCRFSDHEGLWRDIELRAQDRRDRSTNEGIVLNGRDVTQELALERRLGHARKLAMLSEMAGRIAHAFNNALAAMQAHAEELGRDLQPGTTAHEDARAIGAAAERGAGITRQLLGFTGRHVIRPEPVRPSTMVEALRPTLARMLAPDRRLEVVARDEGEAVVVDRAQFEQVLVNLVANARDAMPTGGTVTITIARAEAADGAPPQVGIAVADEGTGIPEDLLPRIFEPFVTTKAAGRGTGLGLAMVASIIRRAGGSVDVASEVGVGTTVMLRLPAGVPRPTPAVPMRAVERREEVPLGSRHVLLVDDDPLVRRASARMLSRAGFTVIEAPDGASALALAADRTVAIDILLTDLMMPGVSGRDVIAGFRPLRPGVPIVCVTGFAAERDDDHSIALEVSAIVAKPFTSQVLLRAVESAIQGARSPGL